MYTIVLYTILLIVIVYIISLLLFIIGNIIPKSNYKSKALEPVSVIVAVKNGEKSLPQLLDDLQKQNYQGIVEYIIVDDQSIDGTKKIINKLEQKDKKFKYATSINGDDRLFFKKKALDAGIKIAKYDILIFTDVDCRLKPGWVDSMAKCFDNKIDYVIGFSGVPYYNNLVSWIQRIDFLMLLTAARAMCKLNFPFASTGQNQAYRKKLYNKIGFIKLQNSIQGDDTLFLQLCMKKKINAIFNDDVQSFVKSRIETNLWHFIKQRIRWSGDAKIMWNYNKKFFTTILSTFLVNLFIIILIIDLLFLNANYVSYLYIILLTKLIGELILYLIGSGTFKSNFNLFMFLYWFILEIPYVLLMGIGSFFVKYVGWKSEKNI